VLFYTSEDIPPKGEEKNMTYKITTDCECPKQVKLVNIARLNREYYKAY